MKHLSWLGVVQRAANAVLVVTAAVLVVFILTRLPPGDPLALTIDSQIGDVDLLQRLRAARGLDQPLWTQFAAYVAALLHGNLGESWRFSGTPVATLMLETMPTTLLLLTTTMITAVPTGIVAGAISVHWRGTWVDHAITAASVAACSMPPVVLATWLMMAATAHWNLSPSGGLSGAASLVFPVIAMIFPPIGVFARMTRAQLLELLGRDYVRCARAKGLAESAVLLRHVLPNAMVPLLTMAGSLAGAILAATAVVETIFNLPGMGRLAILAALSRDYPLTGGVILFFVLAQVVISLVVDLVITAVDSRCQNTLSRP